MRIERVRFVPGSLPTVSPTERETLIDILQKRGLAA
jgi:hypothetical protein